MDFLQNSRPSRIGIIAIDMYVPMRYVSQEDLENGDQCAGKYTIGLGQKNMAFTDDREDIGSMMLSVTSSLMEKYGISFNDIGRLEIGTETLIDKSKSVKTVMMELFGSNTDLEGITNVNACYGGTAALLNSIAWIESSDWDGRYALVVCGDIAVYDVGPARPTGGCGTIAILLGPDAPLVFEPGVRASHCLDIYDFYKPQHSEYATVDGRLSQKAYLSSVDVCYQRYKTKVKKNYPTTTSVTASHFDYFAFHSPYNKLVQKGFARLFYIDFIDGSSVEDISLTSALTSIQHIPIEDTYESKEVETSLKTISQQKFSNIVMPCCHISREVGNCYTGSVFANLLSILVQQGEALVDKRIGMFSFGSGSIATMYRY